MLSALCTTKSLYILRLGNWLCEERRVGDLVQPLHSSASLSRRFHLLRMTFLQSRARSLALGTQNEYNFKSKFACRMPRSFPPIELLAWTKKCTSWLLGSCPLKCCILTFLAVSSCRVVTSCSSRTVCMYRRGFTKELQTEKNWSDGRFSV